MKKEPVSSETSQIFITSRYLSMPKSYIRLWSSKIEGNWVTAKTTSLLEQMVSINLREACFHVVIYQGFIRIYTFSFEREICVFLRVPFGLSECLRLYLR